jgi:hypothetical protein
MALPDINWALRNKFFKWKSVLPILTELEKVIRLLNELRYKKWDTVACFELNVRQFGLSNTLAGGICGLTWSIYSSNIIKVKECKF